MTSRELRQSFLDFFQAKGHTIVPSSSLLPDAPNLLFTNAGMNQFVPIFLGQQKCPYAPPRAADTQKCIRAGGKHNDLEDVGLDTYHHTFFEMLGNWSFGDYFKREAIQWAWELVTERWKFPAHRLYATVYRPDRSLGDPSELDQEAYDYWASLFQGAGLDPRTHIVFGNKKDNFWMMGDTGPCGPCSELHLDLTPQGETAGSLVNRGDAGCIEFWNLVFIQFNANPDGTFTPLPSRHVDTGMGFERVSAIVQCTRGFQDFTRGISNYETDIFRPLFERLEELSGRRYGSTLPGPATNLSDQQRVDLAFRVIADHIRTVSFAIADGILPANTDRNYVVRRILRRAVRYGRNLGFHEPFFFKLVDVLVWSMGEVFPELSQNQGQIQQVIAAEEEAFNATLDRGIKLFQDEIARRAAMGPPAAAPESRRISGEFAFKLYDTYGFPLDLTQLMAREAGGEVETAGFDRLMKEQRERAREGQKKQVVEIETDFEPTRFIGFDQRESDARLLQLVNKPRAEGAEYYAILDQSPFYAEMGGQVGDRGTLHWREQTLAVVNTIKRGGVYYHRLEPSALPALPEAANERVRVAVDSPRRSAIERHHTVTHLLHWALHEVIGPEATQKGSYVGPEKLTFDFNSPALTPAQVREVEKRVNERILENAPVSWRELPYHEVKERKDILQFFGDKYGERVRVVQIGGSSGALNGFSMELCGGTHTRATGELGTFRIVGEGAIAAGVRRVEALAGHCAWERAMRETDLLGLLAVRLNAPISELERKLEALLAHQKELEKISRAAQQKEARETARALIGKSRTITRGTDPLKLPVIVENVGVCEGDQLQAVIEALKPEFKGVVLLGGTSNGAVTLVCAVSPEFTAHIQAGKILQAIAPLVGGKGGGRPDFARGGGKAPERLDEALRAGSEWLLK